MRLLLTAALLAGLAAFGVARRAEANRLPERLPPHCAVRALVHGPEGFEQLACAAEVEAALRAAGRPEDCPQVGALRDGALVELGTAGACEMKIGRMAGPALRLLGLPIDLNRGSIEDLESLPGVGPTLALRIQAARPYRSTEELEQVAGIGPERLAALKLATEVAAQ